MNVNKEKKENRNDFFCKRQIPQLQNDSLALFVQMLFKYKMQDTFPPWCTLETVFNKNSDKDKCFPVLDPGPDLDHLASKTIFGNMLVSTNEVYSGEVTARFYSTDSGNGVLGLTQARSKFTR